MGSVSSKLLSEGTYFICGHLSRLSHVRQNLLVCFRVTRLESRPLCWLGGQVNDARPVLLRQESFSIEVVGCVADPRRIVRVETASHSRAHDRDSLGQLGLRETYAQCPRDLLDNLAKLPRLSISTGNHQPRRLALPSILRELSKRRRAACSARHHGFLRSDPTLVHQVRAGIRSATEASAGSSR